MPLHPRLVIDRWGSRHWILHDEGLAHPLVIISDLEMTKFLNDVQEQKDSFEFDPPKLPRKKKK